MLHDAPNQQLLFKDVTVGLESTSSYVQSENDLVDDDHFLSDDSQSEEEELSDPPAVLNLGLAQEQPFPSKKISGGCFQFTEAVVTSYSERKPMLYREET